MKRLRQLLNWRFRDVIAININMYRFHFHSVPMLCRRNKPQTLTAIQEALMLYPKKFVFVIFGQLKIESTSQCWPLLNKHGCWRFAPGHSCSECYAHQGAV